MRLIPPSEAELLIKTDRLILEPVTTAHAEEMAIVLSDADLYSFVPQDPPEAEKLMKTYEFWEKRISPQNDELWLNWIARLKSTDELIGHFQAGFKSPTESSVAYTVGLRHQRKGFARESLEAILLYLRKSLSSKTVKAWIDTRNVASIELVKKLGMRQVGFVKDADQFKGNASDEYIFHISFED